VPARIAVDSANARRVRIFFPFHPFPGGKSTRKKAAQDRETRTTGERLKTVVEKRQPDSRTGRFAGKITTMVTRYRLIYVVYVFIIALSCAGTTSLTPVGSVHAAPAPWYRWHSKVDGRTVCAQFSPGQGWEQGGGAFRDGDCRQRMPVFLRGGGQKARERGYGDRPSGVAPALPQTVPRSD